MRELILHALNEAYEKLERQIPLTKNKLNFISISDVSPLKVPEFMRENNVPEDAWFDGEDNGDDAFSNIGLSWYTDVPTTTKDQMAFRLRRFGSISWYLVYNTLIENGYLVCGYDSALLREFDGTNLYTMYINEEFDRIEKYYSLRFKKI